MTVALGAFLLGTAGQQVTSRNVRLSLGASWRPSSAVLGGLSGVAYGPAGSMGELTLVNPTTLNVNPFVAIIQGTHSSVQGQYHVPNDTVRAMAVTAQHASQYRRALVCVTVDDAEAAGVASTALTDRARLHIVDGALSAVAPGALPAVPSNTLLLGEVAIPPTGQVVTITPYNPRTTGRGGILPVLNDASLLPGHAGALPVHDGEVRWHPVNGLEVGIGGVWKSPTSLNPIFVGTGTGTAPAGNAGWSNVPISVAKIDTLGTQLSAPHWICRRDGWYDVGGVVAISSNAANRRGARVQHTPVSTGVAVADPHWQTFAAAYVGTTLLSLPSNLAIECRVGDKIQMDGFQDSGSALTFSLSSCSLNVHWRRGL